MLRPGQRRRRERILTIADIGALRDEPLNHREIAFPGGAMQRGAIVDADHVPVPVFVEQKLDGFVALVHVCEEQREADGVALGKELAATTRSCAQLTALIEELP